MKRSGRPPGQKKRKSAGYGENGSKGRQERNIARVREKYLKGDEF